MISRQFDMNITNAEFAQANAWWQNLSINQMKAFEKQYFPTWRSGAHKRLIHQMWEEEGKPEPQELIPVLPEFQ